MTCRFTKKHAVLACHVWHARAMVPSTLVGSNQNSPLSASSIPNLYAADIRVYSELKFLQEMTKTHNGESSNKYNGSKSFAMTKKKKNQQRLGGKGLSLEVFAKAKTKNNDYNPSLIKKQREFYKNAKYVNKYKKSLKQQNESQSRPSPAIDLPQDGDETGTAIKVHKKNKKNNLGSLKQIYESKRQEEEKVKMEKEALVQEKKEAREKSEAQRKEQRAKMYKKTRSGQPVMKYRIAHLLESIQR